MNLRTFSAISAVSMLVLGGCVIVGTTPGGGNGGDGGEVTNGGAGGVGGAGVGAGGTNAGGAGGGTAGAGGAPVCAKTCSDAITDGVPPCAEVPASVDLYNALAACSCERAAADPMPGCKDLCGDNLCTVGGSPSADCGKCLQSGNCMTEFGACSGDT